MTITLAGIKKKLGFDPFTWRPEPITEDGSYTEYDGRENPFKGLTLEELEFLRKENKKRWLNSKND